MNEGNDVHGHTYLHQLKIFSGGRTSPLRVRIASSPERRMQVMLSFTRPSVRAAYRDSFRARLNFCCLQARGPFQSCRVDPSYCRGTAARKAAAKSSVLVTTDRWQHLTLLSHRRDCTPLHRLATPVPLSTIAKWI